MKNNNTPYSLKQIFAKSSFGIAEQTIRDLWQMNRKLIYLDIAITFILSDSISGYLYYLFTTGHAKGTPYVLVLIAGIIKFPLLTIILFLIVNRFSYQFLAALHKNTMLDKERNYAASAEGYKGTSHKMTEDEKKEIFTCGDFATQTGNYLGCEPDDMNKLYALNMKSYGINGNVCVTGAPGCGKSRCLVIPTIFQTIRRGESMIISDVKGELYRDTAAVAKANGYVVKILNFRPKQSLHTDTCDYMSAVGQSIYNAQSFSKTVIDNTSDGKAADFWTNSEFNLFTGVSMLINTNGESLGYSKTLGSVYQLLCANTVDEFESMCNIFIDSTHPAAPYLNTFMNGDKTVKGNTYAGLQIRLGALADPIVQKITGTPDIDLSLPGKQKCIYYISAPDTDRSRAYLVALYFTLQYNTLIDYADEQESGHLPVRVTMMLDEFPNMGVIPSFPEKLSTVRSRWIDTWVIIQGIEQLQKMYPDNEWETIMNDCSTRILINTNTNINAKYFSDLSGEQTTEESNIRYEESAGDLLKVHTTYTVSQSHGERKVYTPGEVLDLKKSRLLVFISQSSVVELEKVDFSAHPMCKEMRKWVSRYHAPKWILQMSEDERRKFRIYDEVYKKESIDDIVLCTDRDFLKPWNKNKEQELQDYIKTWNKKNVKNKSNANPSLLVENESFSENVSNKNKSSSLDKVFAKQQVTDFQIQECATLCMDSKKKCENKTDDCDEKSDKSTKTKDLKESKSVFVKDSIQWERWVSGSAQTQPCRKQKDEQNMLINNDEALDNGIVENEFDPVAGFRIQSIRDNAVWDELDISCDISCDIDVPDF